MQLILNEYAPFLRRSYGYLKNLFAGFQAFEILIRRLFKDKIPQWNLIKNN